MNIEEIKAREQAAQNGDIGAIQTSQLDIKPLIAEVEKLTKMYGEAEETNEKLICSAEKAESENATLKKEYDEQDNAHHKLFMAYCEQQKQIATLEEALEARLIELKASCNGDSAETYTTGYRNGHRNGQIELIEWALKKPSKSVCQAQQTHETQEAEK